jgi:hypothetical protein
MGLSDCDCQLECTSEAKGHGNYLKETHLYAVYNTLFTPLIVQPISRIFITSRSTIP